MKSSPFLGSTSTLMIVLKEAVIADNGLEEIARPLLGTDKMDIDSDDYPDNYGRTSL